MLVSQMRQKNSHATAATTAVGREGHSWSGLTWAGAERKGPARDSECIWRGQTLGRPRRGPEIESQPEGGIRVLWDVATVHRRQLAQGPSVWSTMNTGVGSQTLETKQNPASKVQKMGNCNY